MKNLSKDLFSGINNLIKQSEKMNSNEVRFHIGEFIVCSLFEFYRKLKNNNSQAYIFIANPYI